MTGERLGERGLTSGEAARSLAERGPNEIEREKPARPLLVLLDQFKSPIIWVLAAASGISAVLHEVADAVAIGIILLVNGLVGFFQELRAERAVFALRSLTARSARSS